MRAIDVARTAGISAQAVRHYEDLGLLPAVERTPSGYRAFTEEHVRAVAAVRALAAGHGWAVARTVMRAVRGGDVPAALAAVDAAHAELHQEREALATVLDAFTATLREAPRTSVADAPAAARPLRIGAVAEAVGVRTPVLRLWESRGLLRPERERDTGYRVYPPTETRIAHAIALLRRGAYPLPTIDAVIAELRASGNPDRLREALAHRERELTSRSREALRAATALNAHLDDT
ncbi:MerR family transcriptional regulator [Streptomyces boninensis]|uniref:MerR family transcriptional regulator n=1 Tax=Streptomyces boninensis TaxID=2039455 RepID=UPI003B21AA46